jgi:hypothetical protein
MSLTVRAYNVLFGDCILLSWDEDDGEHHAWVDFGNLSTEPNVMFDAIYDDVLAQTGGRLDLVLVTHRHLDHLEGFYTCRQRFRRDFQVDRLWHAHVIPALDDVFKLAADAMVALLPQSALSGEGEISRLYHNNYYLTTGDRMAAIIQSFPAGSVHAIHRQLDLRAEQALPPRMRRMRIQVLAPEQDSGLYLQSLQEGLAARQALQRSFDALPAGASRPATQSPRQASAEAAGYVFLPKLADFARLRRQLRTGGVGTLAAVDTTRNNTSVVTKWIYDGSITLLLTGDAELMSWSIMRRNGADFAADLLKVGHHGSINASPPWSFERVFPQVQASNAVLLSTDHTAFTGENEVPELSVVQGWRARVTGESRLRRTDEQGLLPGGSVAFQFSS